MKKLSLGLALGGGGARGIAHIGALQVLHSNGVKPDIIAGTSSGSTIASMYAATLDPVWIENKFREFMKSSLFSNFNSGSLIDGRNKETFLEKVTTKIKQHYMVVLGLNKSFVASRAKTFNEEKIEERDEYLDTNKIMNQEIIKTTASAYDNTKIIPK